jgi:hypothetical protein
VKHDLQTELSRALERLRATGYPVTGPVKAVVDEKLAFMGYTTERWDRHLVVVSGVALEQGLVEGLLVHELSHVYRTETKHPSHDPALLGEEINRAGVRHRLDQPYQGRALRAAVNHLQDLYADDVSFAVFRKSKALTPAQAGEFFLGWIAPEPLALKDQEEEGWANATLLIRNAFALANLARHEIPDPAGIAARRNERFLQELPPLAGKRSEWFHAFMRDLPERVTREGYRRLLARYLDNLVALARELGR